MGDAHRLLNGNALVIDSTCLPQTERLNRMVAWEALTWNEWKRDEWHPNDCPYWACIREIKRNDVRDVLYDVHIEDPNELVGWQVFGGARVAGLYPAGVQVD